MGHIGPYLMEVLGLMLTYDFSNMLAMLFVFYLFYRIGSVFFFFHLFLLVGGVVPYIAKLCD